MNRITFSLLILGLSLVATVLCWTAEPQPTASDNDAAQLKAEQAERVKVLTQLVDVLASEYKLRTVGFAQVSAAAKELCDALLDSTDEPEKRVALLTKQLDKANDFLKTTQTRYDAGTVAPKDLFRAKSLYLDVDIKLLRERSGKRPLTRNPTSRE
ncbi:MAG: hypothetical protein ABSG53_06785 [Thermoguttaceae bacterium]|jgi:chaperonin cofactor prefoldin